MSRILYGCCVGSHEKLAKNVLPRLGGSQLIATYEQASITAAYNAILRAVRPMMRPGDALVLLHDDLEIVDAQGETVIFEAVERFDVSGPIGCQRVPDGILWWEAGLVGLQQTDSMRVGAAPHLGPAHALDGSCLILSDAAVRGLHFDEDIPGGWHGYDVDLCLRAHTWRWSDRAVGVVPLATHHHTTVGFKSPEIAADWQRAHEYVQQKWGRREGA